MIDHLKKQNDLDRVLDKMDKGMLDELYLRVFSSADGELVLRDLANRLFVGTTTVDVGFPDITDFNEGMRAVYLSIMTRLLDAVNPQKES